MGMSHKTQKQYQEALNALVKRSKIERIGYVVQTPYGYFEKLQTVDMEDGSRQLILCRKYLADAKFIKDRKDAETIWETTGGRILTVMEHWTKKTTVLKTEDPDTETDLFPAVEPDPSYYEEDCGYQPDPDWEE